MKSFNLIIFFILTIFVITSKANIEGQINEKKPISGGGYKVWLNEVNGFDQNDPVNGYAGIIGKPITSIRVDGGTAYRVHLLDLGRWLGKITKNDQTDPNSYAGHINGKPIDGFVIGGNVDYAVHLLNGEWLPVVNGYDLSDSNNGYAGIFGKPIDAVMIRGRTYATSYTDDSSSAEDQCSIQGGTCISSDVCTGGSIIKGLCSDQTLSNCCILNKNGKSGSGGGGGSFNVLYIIGIVLAVLIVIIVILYMYFALSKQWIKRSITTSIKNIPTLNNNNNDNNNNYNPAEDLPPSYFDVVNDNSDDISGLITNNTSVKKISSSNTHSQVKLPNSNSITSGIHSTIGMSKSERYNEKKDFPSDIKISQSERIIHPTTLKNNGDDDDDIIIERINNDNRRVTFTAIERSKAIVVNNDDTENNQNETNDISITIPSIERSKDDMKNNQ